MKNRILDANEIFSGGEPKFTREITKEELTKVLNWYSQNRVQKDSHRYAYNFFKRKHNLDVDEQLKNVSSTFGFLCRIISNGATLDPKSSETFESFISDILSQKKEYDLAQKTKKVKTVQAVAPVQDRTEDKISEIAGELEGAIDDYILSKFKTETAPAAILNGRVKGVHTKKLFDIFQSKRIEFDNILTTKDKQLIEGYSNFSKSEIKKIVAYCDRILTELSDVKQTSIKNRKPRKRKIKTVDQIISKMMYCEEFPELGLKSVDPKSVVGANQLWVYNTKYKKIGVYHSLDVTGFSVKGTTLLNFDEKKSIQKTVRKPEDFIPKILSGGKVYLRSALNELNTVDTELTGRIGNDTILLRVMK